MNLITLIVNVILLVFSCLVFITDGVNTQAPYLALSLLLILVPALNVFLVLNVLKNLGWLDFRFKAKPYAESEKNESRSTRNGRIGVFAIICNLLLFGFICWAYASQYPHPSDPGFIWYSVFLFLTPLLGLMSSYRSFRFHSSKKDIQPE